MKHVTPTSQLHKSELAGSMSCKLKLKNYASTIKSISVGSKHIFQYAKTTALEDLIFLTLECLNFGYCPGSAFDDVSGY